MKKVGNGKNYTYKYEVFNPYTFQQLNLSVCDNITIDIYIPFILDEKTEKIYNDLINQGYNPLDINSKFYNEICTPYTSENGTDVLLDDREEFIYGSLINGSLCPEGCYYAGFDSGKKTIKCECKQDREVELVDLDFKHLSGNNIYNSFLSTLRATNYIVIQCKKLVFSLRKFRVNFGSIVTLLLFFVYLIFMFIYFVKGIIPIKLHASRLIFQRQKKEIINRMNLIEFKEDEKNKDKIKKNISKSDTNNKGNYPPKRAKGKNSKTNAFEEDFAIEIYKTRIVKRKKRTKESSAISKQNLFYSEAKKGPHNIDKF